MATNNQPPAGSADAAIWRDTVDEILRRSTIADYVGSTSMYRLTPKDKTALIVCDGTESFDAEQLAAACAHLLAAEAIDVYASDIATEALAAYARDAAITISRVRVSYLPYADLTIYNATYNPIPADDPRDVCGACKGAGGSTYTEYQGDPPMGGMVDFFEQCEKCIANGLCPGCSQPLAYSFDYSALGNDTPLIVRATGWFYAGNTGVRTIEVINAPIGQYSQTYGVYEYNAYQFDAFEADTTITSADSEFTCLVCGWYSGDIAQRLADAADSYYADYDDVYEEFEDYPMLDANEFFPPADNLEF